MRAVSGYPLSSQPLSLRRAAAIISKFSLADTATSPEVAAYIRRASRAFNELLQFHSDLKSSLRITHHEINVEVDNGSRVVEVDGERDGKRRKKIDMVEVKEEKSDDRKKKKNTKSNYEAELGEKVVEVKMDMLRDREAEVGEISGERKKKEKKSSYEAELNDGETRDSNGKKKKKQLGVKEEISGLDYNEQHRRKKRRKGD